MNMIAYPPVLNAKRIVPLRNVLLFQPRKAVLVDRAERARLAMENMNKLGAKTFKARFMPAPMFEIVKKVCQEHNVSLMLVASDSRKRIAVKARNEAMYLIKAARPKLSSFQIARWFDRDHTSVLHGIAGHASKNGLPNLVGFSFERVRARNARIAAEKRARLAAA